MIYRSSLVALLVLMPAAGLRAQDARSDDMIRQLLPSSAGVKPAAKPEMLALDKVTPSEVLARLTPGATRSLGRSAGASHRIVLAPGREIETLASLRGLPEMQVAVSFQGSSDALAPEADGLLSSLGQALADPKLASFNFLIGVHTDAVGSDEYNRSLADLRAKAIVAQLETSYGVAKGRLIPIGFGRLTEPAERPVPAQERVRVVNLEDTKVDRGLSTPPGVAAVKMPPAARPAPAAKVAGDRHPRKAAPSREPRVAVVRTRVAPVKRVVAKAQAARVAVVHAVRRRAPRVVQADGPVYFEPAVRHRGRRNPYGIAPAEFGAQGEPAGWDDGYGRRRPISVIGYGEGGRGGNGGNGGNGGSSSSGGASSGSSSGSSSSSGASSGSSSGSSSSGGGTSSGSGTGSGAGSGTGSGTGSGAGSGAGTGGHSGGGWSDRRLKRDIVRLGTSPSGLPIYRFHYVWGGPAYVGVMAQDLLTLAPEAVIVGRGGYMMVDYDKIDVRMVPFDQWAATNARTGVAAFGN